MHIFVSARGSLYRIFDGIEEYCEEIRNSSVSVSLYEGSNRFFRTNQFGPSVISGNICSIISC